MEQRAPGAVQLRAVSQADLATFVAQQLDPATTQMAAFPSRARPAFLAHWAKILHDPTVIAQQSEAYVLMLGAGEQEL